MPRKLDALKEEVTKLSPSAFAKFAAWVYNQAAKRDYEAQADDSTGISHLDVLRVFEREFQISHRRPDVLSGSSGGSCMADFYERTRVRGCAFKNDADMMLAEWGKQEGGEFRLAYTRQLIPTVPTGDDQIWQLMLDMRFPSSEQLLKLGSGTRWFRSLRDREKLLAFIYSSRVGHAVEKMKPTRVLLSYQDVE
jgi:hypothetical protein